MSRSASSPARLGRDAGIDKVLPALAAPGLQVLRQGLVEPGNDLADARAEARDHRVEPGVEIDIAHIPDHAGKQQILNGGVEAELHLPVDAVVERIDRVVQPLKAVGFVDRHKGHDDGGHIGIRLVDQAHDAGRAAAIDHRVGEIGRDDLPPQAMVFRPQSGNLSRTSRGKYWDSSRAR